MNLIQNFEGKNRKGYIILARLNIDKLCNVGGGEVRIIPSLVRTEESGEQGTKLVRDLFSLGTGRGLTVAGVKAGSIFQGDTLSGRGTVEFSSHRTLNQDI